MRGMLLEKKKTTYKTFSAKLKKNLETLSVIIYKKYLSIYLKNKNVLN